MIGYDRHIYLYELGNEEWTLKKSLTKELSAIGMLSNSLNSSTISTNISTGGVISESIGGSIADRLKQFQGGVQKKQSLIVTSTSIPKNMHLANINSANLVNNKYLVTSDYAGFVKVWNI